jgi:hypothetical protein
VSGLAEPKGLASSFRLSSDPEQEKGLGAPLPTALAGGKISAHEMVI